MDGRNREQVLERAEKLEDKGEWNDAADLYRSLLDPGESSPEQVEINIAVGRCLIGGGDPEEAEEWLARAESLAPRTDAPAALLADIEIQLGFLAEAQGRLTKMRDRFVKAHGIRSKADLDLTDVILLEAHSELRLGDIDAAVELLLELDTTRLEPEQLAGYLDAVGLVLLARGEAFAATKVLEQAVAIDERTDGDYVAAHSRLLLAKALLRSGNRRTAKRLLDDVLDTYEGLRNARDLSEVHALYGLLHEDSGRYPQAIQSYRDGFNQDIRSDDPVGHAIAYRSLGRVYMKRGVYEQAHEYFESARNILSTVDDPVESTKLMVEEANLLLAENDYDRAIRMFENALRLAEQTEDDRRIAIVKRCLASALREDGQIDRAVDLLKTARDELKGESGDPIEEQIDKLLQRAGIGHLDPNHRGDLRELEELLDDLGEALLEQGNYDEAMEALKESAELDRMLETPLESQARSLVLLGRTHARLGQRREAKRAYEDAMELYASGEDELGQSEAWFYLGRWFLEEGQFQKALTHFRKGLRIDQQKSDTVNVARALRAIASVYRRLGNLERANEHIGEAQEALVGTDDPSEQGEIDLEAARIAISRDDAVTAQHRLDAARRSLTGNTVGLAMCDHVEARLAFVEGAYPRALAALDRARELFEQKDDLPELDDLFDDIGEVRLAAGEIDSAREAVEQSLEIGKGMGWSSGRGRSLLLLARIAMRENDLAQARERLREAFQAYEGDAVGMSEAKTLSGELYEKEQDLDRAIEELKEARRLDQEHGDLRGLATCNRRLAGIYQRRQEWMRAEEALEQAEDQLKQARASRELALVQVDFGEYWLRQGDAQTALRRFKEALPGIEAIPNDKRELSRLYSLMINAHQAVGDLGAALQLMRRAELERTSVWHAVLWDLDPELVQVASSKYGQSDFQGAVAASFILVEDRIQDRFSKFKSGEKHEPASVLVQRALKDEAPGLCQLITGAFGFIRNPVAHQHAKLNGVDALAAIFVAHLILQALATERPATSIVDRGQD